MGGGGNRFSDRRISQKKLFGFRIWRIFYTDLRILLIQRIADLSNILARIVDLACNLVRILDCDFIVELLADSNLDKTIVGSRILLQIRSDRRICIPLFTPPPRSCTLVIVLIIPFTLVPEVYLKYYFHCEGERKNKPRLKTAIDSSSRANQFEFKGQILTLSPDWMIVLLSFQLKCSSNTSG